MWPYSGKDGCNKGEGEGVRGGKEDKCGHTVERMDATRVKVKG